MNTNEKITAAVANLWPGERGTIAQLMHEGAWWADEGLTVALMAWDEAAEDTVAVAWFSFNTELELEDFEECFAGMDAYVQDKDWEIQG